MTITAAEMERRDRLHRDGVEAIYAECRRWGYAVTLRVAGFGDWACAIRMPRHGTFRGRDKTRDGALAAAWEASLRGPWKGQEDGCRRR